MATTADTMASSSTNPSGMLVKRQVVDKAQKRFKQLKFGIQSGQDIVNQAVIEVSNVTMYDVMRGREPTRHGVLDKRLGVSSKTAQCATCDQKLQDCPGHFGHVRLPLPVFHIGYLRYTMKILQEICKQCSRLLLKENDRRLFLTELRRRDMDNMRRTAILKRINETCRKVKDCPYCGGLNGQIRKVGALKLVHDQFVTYNKSTSQKKVAPITKVRFDNSFMEAKKHNPELEKHVRKAMEDLNPLRVLNLFKRISATDCELLGIDPVEGRPEMFLWQYVPAPPVCIRPSVAQEGASNEDDITAKLAEIVWMAGLIRQALQKGTALAAIMEQWEFLQLQLALWVNSDVPGLSKNDNTIKRIRGFCQRLKGKQGRFRGNLSGKRVDFSGRTVISPDPNLGIDEVCVPLLVAMNLTYPERVNTANIETMRACVRNGPHNYPGAQQVIKHDGVEAYKVSLRFGDKENIAKHLNIGDTVERHLVDGDIALFNRQPSLHKLSIMSHRVKVRSWRTFRLNECVCTPYNADFDGDEMNLHIPQTEEARAEANTLMGVKHNLATPKNGEPIIAATQDFVTASYLLSSKDQFFDRKTFAYICLHMMEGTTQLDLPPPAIVKPQVLWTGKQVFSMLMRPNKESPVKVNLVGKCREFVPPSQRPDQKSANDLCPNDGWLVVRNSQVLLGRMDKSIVGEGKKDSIFYVIMRDFGPDHAVEAMNRLARLCARMLGNQGFSIGIGDVFPTAKLRADMQELVKEAVVATDRLIEQKNNGTLERAAGCTMDESLENKISNTLSTVRTDAGKYCIQTLSRNNAPWIMAQSGSKGSQMNVAQMIALVGQQIIGGERVTNGFQDRTLPHFRKHEIQTGAKGFVASSFYTGLRATEFIFHAMSGREGLVDTAVKTAETGYMSRRLMKSLEDLSSQYDDTVRTSGGTVVQFQFGGDRLDPLDMEGHDQNPVNFDRTYYHAEGLTWSNEERGLVPDEIRRRCQALLQPERDRYLRRGLVDGELLAYNDETDYGCDEHESRRHFIETVANHVEEKLVKPLSNRQELGLAKTGAVEKVSKVSERTLDNFISLCLEKYKKAHVEPGHAVGAIGAQSIGEPGTQMTLKTFHFAGVAGMSITQGVPRIKEIINASKLISTPVITCPLLNERVEEAAHIVRGRIEKTYLKDVLRSLEDEWEEYRAYITLGIDMDALQSLSLDISLSDIATAIVKAKKLKIALSDIQIFTTDATIEIRVNALEEKRTAAARSKTAAFETSPDLLTRVAALSRVLPNITISGYPEATRAIIQATEVQPDKQEKSAPEVEDMAEEKTDARPIDDRVEQAGRKEGEEDVRKEKKQEKKKIHKYQVLVEGYGLRQCMNTVGVKGTACTTNSVLECRDVLGIEAARTTIAKEIEAVMKGMNIDPRHMQLLADVMTYKGEILGITRFGLSKMRDSVLQLASFEKTPDHLFEAATMMKADRIEGVSESIIMGKTMTLGTGAFQLVRDLKLDASHFQTRPTVFEDAWAEGLKLKRDTKKRSAAVAFA